MRIATRVVILIVLSVSAVFAGDSNAKLPGHSIELSGGWLQPYKDTLTGVTNGAGAAYAGMVTLGYVLGENNQLSIHLLQFRHHFINSTNALVFSYGFGFKHFLPRQWADLGIVRPFLSYGILLSQAILPGLTGRGMAHTTRIALGADLAFEERSRLMIEATWESSDYPSFTSPDSRYMSAFALSTGWRVLF